MTAIGPNNTVAVDDALIEKARRGAKLIESLDNAVHGERVLASRWEEQVNAGLDHVAAKTWAELKAARNKLAAARAAVCEAMR